MTVSEYLEAILKSQTLEEASTELEDLRKHREDVEKVLRAKYTNPAPTIRYGGSKAKGTIIRESYDLDIICYFENDDTSAGETLEDIYNNVAKTLEKDYFVERKTSALRLKTKEKVDFHIDVVPGRFTDEKKEDAFLYISTGEKKRLKTNLQVHIDHVKNSGVIDALRLVKLWRVRNSLSVRNFALELMAIDLLATKKKSPLADQLEHFFREVVAKADTITVKDPANPEGNDLAPLLDATVRAELKSVSNRTVGYIEQRNWEAIFGQVTDDAGKDKRAQIHAAAAVATPSKPWSW
jgi:hypothetical protein